MNAKRFLTTVMLVVLSVSLFTLATTTKSTQVRAQVQADASRIILVNEPAVRMQSGAIQSSDGNYADFRPHAQTSAKQIVGLECMTDEQVAPRRQSGCIQ